MNYCRVSLNESWTFGICIEFDTLQGVEHLLMMHTLSEVYGCVECGCNVEENGLPACVD